ncbi:tRNA (adenosine(37)-N6)-threonylcarbamoyltransferase complex ATPase subunit type 1 TsaE [Flaviflexus huanghaiensis]|uniref:tRNA (adenosine(37)-N6)-threonylcarbamoyltransferase complex ATPase subunit type 1 TsaE n=1 Tax=Flaviflexus huanghaiensis TaxID=1111473 RepID=UPI0015FABFE2|nr:tRNA (adenosine(37)-N6)-threonylcarbamoyltransferase complex ATPase subunit type 1 TsaE [Flaviflexus huanghaiensis]
MELIATTAEDTQEVGRRLGGLVAAGDLIMLAGPLGAGKTTFVQGLAQGMGVHGRVTSPTFVISHIHRGSIDLVHVDAYRLDSLEDVESLDLDASLGDSVTVIEWGRGKTDALSDDRLEIDIARPLGSRVGDDPEDLVDDTPRTITLRPTGPRSAAIVEALST